MESNIKSFESDYTGGMLPEILEALAKTNNEKTSGYGPRSATTICRSLPPTATYSISVAQRWAL